MIRVPLAALALALPAAPAAAQAPASPAASANAAAYAADHASIDSIVGALYAVISGERGERRDWARFRALFHPSARMIPTGRRAAGEPVTARSITPEQYETLSGPRLEGDGFQEREIARRVERFGHIAHVFSTYEARNSKADPQPFVRGINSIQLFNDGTRWWVLTVAWSAELPDMPLPEAYLPR